MSSPAWWPRGRQGSCCPSPVVLITQSFPPASPSPHSPCPPWALGDGRAPRPPTCSHFSGLRILPEEFKGAAQDDPVVCEPRCTGLACPSSLRSAAPGPRGAAPPPRGRAASAGWPRGRRLSPSPQGYVPLALTVSWGDTERGGRGCLYSHLEMPPGRQVRAQQAGPRARVPASEGGGLLGECRCMCVSRHAYTHRHT